MKCYE